MPAADNPPVKPGLCLLCLLLAVSGALPAQESAPAEGVVLSAGSAGAYTLVERSDWSRYDNGKYRGHVYREVRASITPELRDEAKVYRGNFIVLEETLRDMRQSARGVDAVVPVRFTVSPGGNVTVEDDRGFPSLRGFPAYPAGAVRPGDRWTAEGLRAVDPLNQGSPLFIPLIAEYQYRGTEIYRDTPVHRINAVYASRYRNGSAGPVNAGSAEAPVSQVEGTHTVDIILRVSDGLPLMMRDTLDETFTWADGSTLRFRGFTLIFGEGSIPLNRDVTIASLGERLGGPPARGAPESAPQAGPAAEPPALAGAANIDLAPVPEGVRLTIRDLRFIPDSDELLPEERGRLDLIAGALLGTPDRTFLVEGHTAAVGRPQGEMELSLLRAKRISDELTSRGIPAERFVYRGWGGARPLAPNTDEAGRARNRRVEITILE
ncbi:MAG: OmpA family protein [Spirochaetaceae bacterium]|jgi:outer membrane protein OmpA-like peptidoglycan-associated protein|nr:OmpA family protein [Spirochaetaceae bacterium]